MAGLTFVTEHGKLSAYARKRVGRTVARYRPDCVMPPCSVVQAQRRQLVEFGKFDSDPDPGACLQWANELFSSWTSYFLRPLQKQNFRLFYTTFEVLAYFLCPGIYFWLMVFRPSASPWSDQWDYVSWHLSRKVGNTIPKNVVEEHLTRSWLCLYSDLGSKPTKRYWGVINIDVPQMLLLCNCFTYMTVMLT